mmetsp:Transcript_83581/g.269371  ORF Transcript_83581/g.269371 Transcript_83581/m.269371 type:complete len:665 (-) Transcript_83581:6-2000(-)
MARSLVVLLVPFCLSWQLTGAYTETFIIKQDFKSPDCVDKLVVTTNGMIPGPEIRVQPGEEIIITVKNEMKSQAVNIHWHGMQHTNGTVWQDGASMISSCPIPPMSSWTYHFNANNEPGTFQYHGHIGGVRTGGLGGALIIEGDISEYAAEADGGDIVVVMTDWYHALADELVVDLLQPQFRWPGDGQSILVNGKGNFDCNNNAVYQCNNGTCLEGASKVCGAADRQYYRPSSHKSTCSTCPGYEILGPVTAGKTYLFRFINGGTLMLMNVAIEGHNMTVIEVDGSPTQKYHTSSVDLNSGQRVAVLVTMDQPLGVYTLSVSQRARNAPRFGYALIQYDGSAAGASTVDPTAAVISQPAWNDNKFTFDFQNEIKGLYTGSNAIPAVPSSATVARTFIMLVTQERMNAMASFQAQPSVDSLAVAVGSVGSKPQDFCDSAGNTKPLRWLFGRRTWKYPATPVLSKLYFDIGAEDFTEENLYYAIELGKTYDMVIHNYPACNGVCETHSWHMHGMHFWVLGAGRGEWSGSAAQLAMLNTVDPPMRDTVQTISEGVDNMPFDKTQPQTFGPCGYTVIRFVPKSPGTWMFHCHQLWHIIMGSNAVFYTAAHTIPPPPSNLMLCGEMTVEKVAQKLYGCSNTVNANVASTGSSPFAAAVLILFAHVARAK